MKLVHAIIKVINFLLYTFLAVVGALMLIAGVLSYHEGDMSKGIFEILFP